MATIGFKLIEGKSQPRTYREAASQSFKKGDLVKLAAGKVTIISSDQAIFGVALQDAAAVTNTAISVLVIDPTMIFICDFDTTVTEGHAGIDYGLVITTAGSMEIESADVTTTSVMVIDRDPKDPTSKVHVRFQDAVLL